MHIAEVNPMPRYMPKGMGSGLRLRSVLNQVKYGSFKPMERKVPMEARCSSRTTIP